MRLMYNKNITERGNVCINACVICRAMTLGYEVFGS